METQNNQISPIEIDGYKQKKLYINQKHLAKTYRKNQAIVYLNKSASEESYKEQIEKIKNSFADQGIKNIKVRSCSNCDIPIFLLSAQGIDSVISSGGVQGGSGPSPGTVGESYSLNFLSQVPNANWQNSNHHRSAHVPCDKDVVTIAVLDTGIDTCLVHLDHLCHKHVHKPDLPCFSDIKSGGWNFVSNNDNIWDDSPGKHGSLVAQYIINQFDEKSLNKVQILPLKTHNKKGIGDLFSIICAIYFAIAKGANIINASWGFYYYFDDRHLGFLHELITVELKKHGILFVTAAGNKIVQDDAFARSLTPGLTDDQLRDLAIHRFYPAHLTNSGNNIISVTTTNNLHVSPMENHSNEFVDLGVLADRVTPTNMQFKVPWTLANGNLAYVGGSSFATAIAAGVIGANCSTGLFTAGLKKSDFLNNPSNAVPSLRTSPLLQIEAALAPQMVRAGRCIHKAHP